VAGLTFEGFSGFSGTPFIFSHLSNPGDFEGTFLVLTDSGGLQEETTVHGVLCITLRHNTERPITCEEGTNILVGNHKDKILAAAQTILNRPGRADPGKVGWACGGADCGDSGGARGVGENQDRGSRPARRRTFCPNGHKKVCKKGLSPAEGMAFAGGGGFYCRFSSRPDGVFDPARGNGPS